jgi:hypothetical protein
MRGSSQAYERSTNRFVRTYAVAANSPVPWTIGKSFMRIASTARRPMPWRAKPVSMISALAIRLPNWSQTIVTTGMRERFERVANHDQPSGETLCTRGSNVVLIQNFERARARQSGDRGRRTTGPADPDVLAQLTERWARTRQARSRRRSIWRQPSRDAANSGARRPHRRSRSARSCLESGESWSRRTGSVPVCDPCDVMLSNL